MKKELRAGMGTNELMTPARLVKLDAIVEQAIDEFGLKRVVDAVARICYEKAQHVLENWQDRPLAGGSARGNASTSQRANWTIGQTTS